MAKCVHSHFLRQALLALAFILEVDILEYWSLLVKDHPGNIWGWYAGICVCVSVCLGFLQKMEGSMNMWYEDVCVKGEVRSSAGI